MDIIGRKKREQSYNVESTHIKRAHDRIWHRDQRDKGIRKLYTTITKTQTLPKVTLEFSGRDDIASSVVEVNMGRRCTDIGPG